MNSDEVPSDDIQIIPLVELDDLDDDDELDISDKVFPLYYTHMCTRVREWV